MYSRMCSLMLVNEFSCSNFIIEKTNSKIKTLMFNTINKSLEKTIEKCMNGKGCQHQDGCARRMNKEINKLVKQEIKRVGNQEEKKEK